MTLLSDEERAAAVIIPAGWALVPVEPTKAMHKAAWAFFDNGMEPGADFEPFNEGAYRAMLAAAPEAPALTAALPIIERAQGWQDISSAPKDGTEIILYAAAWDMSWGTVQTGHFEGDGEGGGEWVTPQGAVDDNDPDFDPDAEFDESEFNWEDNLGPTHWQPLPEPPALADEVAGR